MKLNFFLILLTVLQVSASVSAQNTRMDLKMQNATISQVFDEIERQSEVYFFYNKNQIDETRTISVDFRNKTIDDILKSMLSELSLTYERAGKNIIIKAGDQKNSGAQQPGIKVKGTVKNAAGESLPGVTVMVRGSTSGTISDADGQYELSGVPADGTLIFSFVGMKKIEVAVDGKSTINAVLEDETFGIEEVVAIGYGTVKKSDLTGAVGSVRGDILADRKTMQLSTALQGAIAGVMVTRNNGAPGATASIRIRGVTTIGDSNPLVIIDGVPGDIDQVNPSDVENMSVLKDAASASIYGSRAAAGVILITTKRVKENGLSLNYTFEYGNEMPTELPDYVNVKRYLEMTNELRWNDAGNGTNEYPTYPKEEVDNYIKWNAENPDRYPITDWTKMILKKSAPRQSHLINISGGTDNVKSTASIGYDKTDGLTVDRYYERFMVRSNNDFLINNYLGASLDFNFKRSNAHQPEDTDIFNWMRFAAPVYAAVWSDGRLGEGKSGNNIYGIAKYGGAQDDTYNQLGGKISIDFMPVDGLKFSAIVAPTYNFDKTKTFRKAVPYYSATDPTQLMGYLEKHASTMLTEGRNDSYATTTQFLATYMKTIGNHDLNFMAGYENFSYFKEEQTASRDKYELDSYPYLDIGPLELRDNSGKAYENAYRSYFGRIRYSYKNKYLLQSNIRYDGSSRFHKDYRWGTFPSFSAGWVMSEEAFMKNIPWLSFLKVRASWGALGNERIGNYPYQSTIGFSNALFYKGNTVVSKQTAAQIKYAIQDISWEKTESTDLGIDANFFNNRLHFTGDYFYKTTKDMLLSLEIPDYMGFGNPDQNAGKMNTNGYELEFGWTDKVGDWDYAVSINMSDFKSVMGDLGGTEFLGDQVKKKGSEFNEWYGYLSDGLFQTQEEVNSSPKLNKNVNPGDVKYLDVNGPDGVPDGKISPEYDRVLLGGSLPRYMFGGNVSVGFKGFDFSMAFQGVGSQNSRISAKMIQPLQVNWGHMPKILEGNYWSMYNTAEQNLVAKYPRLTWSNATNFTQMSDFWMFNGRYVRLKNITLGYSIPSFVTDKVGINRVRIYASANDLLSLNKYPKGWDPEMGDNAYPITTSVLFGLSVNF